MNYIFSAVMPLYNSGHYLEEAVESILSQTCGFCENIQIIFVNDGSTDNTEEICLQYQKRYPDNIVYVKKANGGVSSARNEAIPYIRGELTVFVDGDDMWEPDAFQKILKFYEQYGTGVDVYSCKLDHMGDFAGREHPLDYKFERGDRVADLIEEPKLVNSTIGNTIIRSSAIGEIRFDEDLLAGEDAVFTNLILLRNPKLGLISTAVFHYRRYFTATRGEAALRLRKNNRAWYFDVPEHYYRNLFRESEKLHGRVLPFIQQVVAYDLQWRGFNPNVFEVLTAEERLEHIELMRTVLQSLDDDVIFELPKISQYRKNYLFSLKYGANYISRLKLDRWYLVDESERHILNFQAKSAIKICTIEVLEDLAVLQGELKVFLLGECPELWLADENNKRYPLEIMDYPKAGIRGYIGESIVDGKRFRVKVPVHPQMKLSFYLRFRGMVFQMNPGLDDSTGLMRLRMSYCVKGKWIVKYLSKAVCFYENTLKHRLTSEYHLRQELSGKNRGEELEQYLTKRRHLHAIRRCKLKNQVAFVTPRANDRLLQNLQAVYDKIDVPKVTFARMAPYDESYIEDAIQIIYQSKVVVTDDYSYVLKHFGKKDGQVVLQVWHAAGAFKKFGQDGTELFPSVDAMYHHPYDLVSVSAPEIEPIYSQAFDIPQDKVKALGVPRTDSLFDVHFRESTVRRILEAYPNLRGKSIILYAPTFRNYGKEDKTVFEPDLDFDEVSRALREDQMLVICPHPVMKNRILKKQYHNISVVRSISTTDMMLIADLMVTDYSSVIFEFALLHKPIAFFCYDFDYYNRDFYLDYEQELPGPLFKDQGELIEYIRTGDYKPDPKMEGFVAKYMSACDGHSSERIAELIRKYLC